MNRPIIAISANVSKSEQGREQIALDFNYIRAIHDAGGEPFIVTPFSDPDKVATLADGWLITGGADLPPSLYKQDQHPQTKTLHPDRLSIETMLFERFKQNSKPVLGICFGMQFLNVMHGGTLTQHMPDQLGHDRHTEGETSVISEPSSKLSKLGLPQEFEVKCFHHQMIETVARGWRVSAKDKADQAPEAIEELSDRFRIGVQWHPERTLESPASKTLFEQFVKSCANQR